MERGSYKDSGIPDFPAQQTYINRLLTLESIVSALPQVHFPWSEFVKSLSMHAILIENIFARTKLIVVYPPLFFTISSIFMF